MRTFAFICIVFAGCFYDYEKFERHDAGPDSPLAGRAGGGGASSSRGGASGSVGIAGVAGGVAGATGTAGGGGMSGGSGGSAGSGGRGGAAGVGSAGMGGRGGGIGGAAGTGGSAVGTGGAAGVTGAAGAAGATGMGGSAAGTTGVAGRGGTPGSAGASGGTGGTGGAGASLGSGLVLWYRMDETAGTTTADASGNGRNGTVTTVGGGTGAFSTTHQVGTGALNLTSSSATVGAFVSLPASLNAMGATTAITIATWVNVTTDRAWAPVFDFNNSSTTGYAKLTTNQTMTTPNSVRFAITNTGNASEQIISTATRLTTGAWHHIALVLDAGATYTGTIYIDGVAAGMNMAMTLRPSNLGNTANNWIGRSAFTADPLFSGLVDDFRIYSRALSASEISALYALP